MLMGRRLTAKVLSEAANPPAGDSNAAAREQARASHDLRVSLTMDRGGRTSLAQVLCCVVYIKIEKIDFMEETGTGKMEVRRISSPSLENSPPCLYVP